MRFYLLSIAMITGFAYCSNSKKTVSTDELSDKNGTAHVINEVPVCIGKLITQFKAENIQNPPRSVYSYTYNGSTVYYVPALCCDFFSDLYDSTCKLIAHPDGGFTGRGDNSMPDFSKLRSNEKLIWKDERAGK